MSETQQEELDPLKDKPSVKKETPGKNFPVITIVNILLFLGLVVLYLLNIFPLGTSSQPEDASERLTNTQVVDSLASEMEKLNIAFVNSDTLLSNFGFAEQMMNELQREQRRLENDMQQRQTNFQQEAEQFYRDVQSGAMNPTQAQAKEQELMAKQQELVQLNDTYSNQLISREVEINTEIYNRLTRLLEEMNDELGFDYILGFSPGGGILYASDKHDITQKVLQRLNETDETNLPD